MCDAFLDMARPDHVHGRREKIQAQKEMVTRFRCAFSEFSSMLARLVQREWLSRGAWAWARVSGLAISRVGGAGASGSPSQIILRGRGVRALTGTPSTLRVVL